MLHQQHILVRRSSPGLTQCEQCLTRKVNWNSQQSFVINRCCCVPNHKAGHLLTASTISALGRPTNSRMSVSLPLPYFNWCFVNPAEQISQHPWVFACQKEMALPCWACFCAVKPIFCRLPPLNFTMTLSRIKQGLNGQINISCGTYRGSQINISFGTYRAASRSVPHAWYIALTCLAVLTN